MPRKLYGRLASQWIETPFLSTPSHHGLQAVSEWVRRRWPREVLVQRRWSALLLSLSKCCLPRGISVHRNRYARRYKRRANGSPFRGWHEWLLPSNYSLPRVFVRFFYLSERASREILSTKFEIPNNIKALTTKIQNRTFWHLNLGFWICLGFGN